MTLHPTPEDVVGGRSALPLWFALLAGPSAWLLGLAVDYNLVHFACHAGTSLPLHLTTLATIGIVGFGALVGRREWEKAGLEWPGEDGTVADRNRFMCAVGMMGCALFALVILAQWVGKLFFPPCAAI